MEVLILSLTKIAISREGYKTSDVGSILDLLVPKKMNLLIIPSSDLFSEN